MLLNIISKNQDKNQSEPSYAIKYTLLLLIISIFTLCISNRLLSILKPLYSLKDIFFISCVIWIVLSFAFIWFSNRSKLLFNSFLVLYRTRLFMLVGSICIGSYIWMNFLAPSILMPLVKMQIEIINPENTVANNNKICLLEVVDTDGNILSLEEIEYGENFTNSNGCILYSSSSDQNGLTFSTIARLDNQINLLFLSDSESGKIIVKNQFSYVISRDLFDTNTDYDLVSVPILPQIALILSVFEAITICLLVYFFLLLIKIYIEKLYLDENKYIVFFISGIMSISNSISQKRNNFKSFSKKERWILLIFNIFLFLIIFLLSEIFIRLTRPYIDIMAITGQKTSSTIDENTYNNWSSWAVTDAFSAYRGKAAGDFNNSDITINQYGFISTPPLSLEKPDGVIRILFLGGSSTAYTYKNDSKQLAGDEGSWPWKTIEMIQKSFPDKKIEFINGALGGYSTFESYGRLWSRLRFFSPDIIVMYHGWNEMYYWMDVDHIIDWRTLPDGSWGIEKPVERKLKIYEPLLIDKVIQYSQILVYIRLSLTDPINVEIMEANDGVIADDYDHRGLEIFRTNLKLIREASAIMNSELFVIKQATLITEDLPEEDYKYISYSYHGFSHEAHVDAFNQIYRIVDEEIDAEHIIDATELSGRKELFYDHIHLFERGADELAAIVSSSVVDYLLK